MINIRNVQPVLTLKLSQSEVREMKTLSYNGPTDRVILGFDQLDLEVTDEEYQDLVDHPTGVQNEEYITKLHHHTHAPFSTMKKLN